MITRYRVRLIRLTPAAGRRIGLDEDGDLWALLVRRHRLETKADVGTWVEVRDCDNWDEWRDTVMDTPVDAFQTRHWHRVS